jgi:hypothetical protein
MTLACSDELMREQADGLAHRGGFYSNNIKRNEEKKTKKITWFKLFIRSDPSFQSLRRYRHSTADTTVCYYKCKSDNDTKATKTKQAKLELTQSQPMMTKGKFIRGFFLFVFNHLIQSRGKEKGMTAIVSI